MPRTSIVFLLGLLAGCAPDSTSPDQRGPEGDIRAIHIAHRGTPVDSVLRTGALGTLRLGLLAETRNGTLIALDPARAIWGSTHPAVVDESFRAEENVFFERNTDGRARIIAGFGAFRDSVAVEVSQLPARARFHVDTMVTLAANSIDLSGAATAYHTFLFGAQRVDSNEFALLKPSTARITYSPLGDAPFDIFSTARGDTVGLAGRTRGNGRMVVTFAGRSDTLPVQVADSYRVLRLAMSPGGIPRPLPATVTIPAGAAIIFRNETALPVWIGGPSGESVWQVGHIHPGSREAQRFDTPGQYSFRWEEQRCTIIVTSETGG